MRQIGCVVFTASKIDIIGSLGLRQEPVQQEAIHHSDMLWVRRFVPW